MKSHNPSFHLLWLGILSLLICTPTAYAQGNKLKHIAKTLSEHPLLSFTSPLEITKTNTVSFIQTQRASATAASQAITLPNQTSFAQWLDQLETEQVIANNRTRQTLIYLKKEIDKSALLSKEEQENLQQVISTLYQAYEETGKLKNGDFWQISYYNDEDTGIPTADQIHLQLKHEGMWWNDPRIKKARSLPIKSFYLAPNRDNPNMLLGIFFLPTFQPLTKTRQELEQVLETITPSGYTIRITAHELGLSNNRQKFRKGDLHLHLEKPNAKQKQFPVDVSIELWLNTKPYVGIVDPKTRKILVQFKDKVIARNYLILFEKYLTPQSKLALEKIAR